MSLTSESVAPLPLGRTLSASEKRFFQNFSCSILCQVDRTVHNGTRAPFDVDWLNLSDLIDFKYIVRIHCNMLANATTI